MTKVRMNNLTILSVGKLLEEHMTKDGEFGVYKTGYNDGRIALMATTTDCIVNENHVSHMRRSMFGNFPPADKQLTSRLESQIENLEGRLKGLELLMVQLTTHRPGLFRTIDPLGNKNFPTANGDARRIKLERC